MASKCTMPRAATIIAAPTRVAGNVHPRHLYMHRTGRGKHRAATPSRETSSAPNATGTAGLGHYLGLDVQSSNDTITGNVISAGYSGISINHQGPPGPGPTIQGNKIGTDVTGTVPIPNSGDGIFILGSAGGRHHRREPIPATGTRSRIAAGSAYSSTSARVAPSRQLDLRQRQSGDQPQRRPGRLLRSCYSQRPRRRGYRSQRPAKQPGPQFRGAFGHPLRCGRHAQQHAGPRRSAWSSLPTTWPILPERVRGKRSSAHERQNQRDRRRFLHGHATRRRRHRTGRLRYGH